MRHLLFFCTVGTFLLLNACIEDISCYRDMIIGKWVEQTFDGQEPATHLRGVLIFDGKEQNCKASRVQSQTDGSNAILETVMNYVVYCKTLTLKESELEIIRFRDSVLHLKVSELVIGDHIVIPNIKEVTYKKVSSENTNAKTIQNLWEMTECNDPTMRLRPFRIRFDASGSYSLFFLNDNSEWEEKSDETGKYSVYDSFLMTSGTSNWDIYFTFVDKEGTDGKEKKKEVEKMNWSAIGHSSQTSFTFAVVKQ